MYRTVLFCVIIFQSAFSQAIETHGNLLRIHFDQAEIDLSDTLGSWQKGESGYQRAFTINEELILQKKTTGTLPYQYNPAYLSYSLENVTQNKTDYYHYEILVDGHLTYFLQDLGTPQLIKTDCGIWLLHDYISHVYVNNEGKTFLPTDLQLDVAPMWKLGEMTLGPLFAFGTPSGWEYFRTSLCDESSTIGDSLNAINYEGPLFRSIITLEDNQFLVISWNKVYHCSEKIDSIVVNKEILEVDQIWESFNFANSIYLLESTGLNKYTFNPVDSTIVFQYKVLDINPINYYWDCNYQLSPNKVHFLYIKNDSLYLFNTQSEKLSNSWYIGMLNEPTKPIIDSPYVYVHQATRYVSVDEPENELPQKFELFAYPNPFNPTTNISYKIPTVSLSGVEGGNKTTIKIYNSIGQEIRTLVDEYKSPGSYEIKFNAGSLPSGVYFCKFKYGRNEITQKLLLLK